MENIDNNNISKKRKIGRPRLLEVERRAFSIRPGFNEREFEKLEHRAESVGLDVSEFVRRLALNQQFHALPTINRQALAELSKIGSNVNQLARVANSTGEVSQAIAGVKSELEKITLTLTLDNSKSE